MRFVKKIVYRIIGDYTIEKLIKTRMVMSNNFVLDVESMLIGMINK